MAKKKKIPEHMKMENLLEPVTTEMFKRAMAHFRKEHEERLAAGIVDEPEPEDPIEYDEEGNPLPANVTMVKQVYKKFDNSHLTGHYKFEEQVIEEDYTGEDWLDGTAPNILVTCENPGGPLIRQVKVSMVRRPDNKLLARIGVYCYLYEQSVEALLIIERFDEGTWCVEEIGFFNQRLVKKISGYVECDAKVGKYYRARAVVLINEHGEWKKLRQRLHVRSKGMWNDWQADDGYNEEDYVPKIALYDDTPLPPVEDQKYYEKNRKGTFFFRRYYE